MWQKPIVEIHTEKYERGTLPLLLAAYKKNGLPALIRHVGRPLAFYVTLVGEINRLTQLWAYDSLAERQERQAAIDADPQWLEFRQATKGVILTRDSRLTRRVDFTGVDYANNPSQSKPIVDLRSYFIRFDRMKTFVDTTEEFAMQVMLRHIGPPIGYYQTIVGNIQQITHMWGYDSMGDMETRRDARNRDPEWKNYLDASHGIYERQFTQVVSRVKLFPDE